MTDFEVSSRVVKNKGYPFPGVVVSRFENLSGETRYVVESTVAPGMLHIFNGAQLSADATDETRPS